MRSVMDPTLGLRRISCRDDRSCRDNLSRLPVDDTEGVLRRLRFVWTSATFVGVVGRALRAAAAAAEDSDAAGGAS